MTIEEDVRKIAEDAWNRQPPTPPPPVVAGADGEVQQSALWRQLMSAAQVERAAERRARWRWRLGIAARLAAIGLLWAAIARQYYLGLLSARATGVMMVLVFLGVIGASNWLWHRGENDG